VSKRHLRGGIALLFRSKIMKQTIKESRKNQNLTAKELADMLKLDTIDILKIDNLILKDIEEPLKSKLVPILRGDYMDKIPWL
jgi:ribosome-binding protein aMBF1 (putative translation factor)